jgi:hypothetical protein
VSPSEIAFLALGLVLGAAIGAGLVQAVRGRPAPRREVRLTITPNAIPAGRTRTLAIADGSAYPGPVPGSPAADARPMTQAPGGATTAVATAPAAQIRTRVPSAAVVLPSTAVALPVGEARAQARPGPGAVSSPSPAPASAPGGTGDARAMPSAAPGAGGSTPPPAGPAGARETPRATLRATVSVAGAASAAVAVLDAPPPAPVRVAAAAPGTAPVAIPVAVPVAIPPRPPRPGRDDAFTTLVRPRPPAAAPRPSLPSGAIAVPMVRVGSTAPATAAGPSAADRARSPLPPARLAPPSGPTLTRPRPALAIAVERVRAEGEALSGRAATPGPGVTGPEAVTGPCAGPRRMVDERCALADVARDQARAATDALRDAQRAYDVLRERVDRAESLADPRRVAAEKDRLHAAFRAATERAGDPDDTEAAARAWLDELNQLNAAVRDAHRVMDAGGAELRASHPALARLSADADAARIAAENADAGCREAREELAGCEEAEARANQAPAPPPEDPHPFERVWPVDRPDLPSPDRPAPGDLLAGLPPIIRILRGDREAHDRLVATLAAGDADAERDWQLRLSRLVDAIVGRAIEDGYLDLPEDDTFWRLFEHRESRDIVGALSALGFRYDGLGGFADGRVPAARDLSLAVGYAGLDRMRIRAWPRESDIARLYERAVVASDEWLADQAGDLSLGGMVDALGARAAELADLWNAWGRVRPALLEP